jgi:tetratricopeptide (TPR) repeat protein
MDAMEKEMSDITRDAIEQAEHEVSRGNLLAAIRTYRRLAATSPNNLSLINRLGDLYARTSQTDEAVAYFRELAESYRHQRQFVKAIAIYKKIIKLDPTLLDVYETLAELYYEGGLPHESITQFRVLAEYYAKHQYFDRARKLYERIVEISGEPEKYSHLLDGIVESKPRSQSAHTTEAASPVTAIRTPIDLMVFLCHASEDKPAVRELYQHLRHEFLQTWLDEEDLLPGQIWEREIERAVRRSHAVIICLSRTSITKSGYVNKEIKFALDILDEQPEGIIFLIPARLEECEIPMTLRAIQYVDLFKPDGYKKVVKSLYTRARQLGFL